MKYLPSLLVAVLVCLSFPQSANTQTATSATTKWAIMRARHRFPLHNCDKIAVKVVDIQNNIDGIVAFVDRASYPCTVFFDRWNFKFNRDNLPEYYCTLMTHEFGHLAGLMHSSNPNSVMYPTPPVEHPSSNCRT